MRWFSEYFIILINNKGNSKIINLYQIDLNVYCCVIKYYSTQNLHLDQGKKYCFYQTDGTWNILGMLEDVLR